MVVGRTVEESRLNRGLRPLAKFAVDGRTFVVVPDQLGFTGGEAEKQDLVPVGDFFFGGHCYLIVATQPSWFDGDSEADCSGLTRRELQIAVLVANGMVNKEIATKLHISRWTVATHLRRIFSKLGVNTRAAMIYRVRRFLHHRAM